MDCPECKHPMVLSKDQNFESGVFIYICPSCVSCYKFHFDRPILSGGKAEDNLEFWFSLTAEELDVIDHEMSER